MGIALWNRREVLSTVSMEEQTRVVRLLHDAGIAYGVRVVNTEASNLFGANRRGRLGSFGMDPSAVRQYSIYVHKKDAEEAAARIQRSPR